MNPLHVNRVVKPKIPPKSFARFWRLHHDPCRTAFVQDAHKAALHTQPLWPMWQNVCPRCAQGGLSHTPFNAHTFCHITCVCQVHIRRLFIYTLLAQAAERVCTSCTQDTFHTPTWPHIEQQHVFRLLASHHFTHSCGSTDVAEKCGRTNVA